MTAPTATAWNHSRRRPSAPAGSHRLVLIKIEVHPAVLDGGVEEDVAAGGVAEALVERDRLELG